MKKAVLIVEVVALFGAIAWLIATPSWEPLVTTLLLVAALIGGHMKKDEPSKLEPDSTPARPSTTINVTGNNAVVSSNQSGGITAQTVIINPTVSALDARLVMVGTANQTARPDGSWMTTAHLRLETPFPVGNLRIEVHGESIQEIDVNPMRAGMFQTGHAGNRPGYSFTNIPNASGNYGLSIRSQRPETFRVIYAVQ